MFGAVFFCAFFDMDKSARFLRYRARLFDDIVYKNPKNPLVFKKNGGLVYKIVVKIVYKLVVRKKPVL